MIAVTGGLGQLGESIKEFLSYRETSFPIEFLSSKQLDITRREAVRDYFRSRKVEYIINCAAYTNVDKAEDAEQKRQAFAINVTGVENLVHACLQEKVRLIHLSTDYVFDGKTHLPYTEDAQPNPLGYYAQTKRQGEKVILDSGLPSAIVRTSWLYSPYGANFLKTMLRLMKQQKELRVVHDQVGTPTYAADCAVALFNLLERSVITHLKQPTVWHFSNEGIASWYDFAVAIAGYIGYDGKVEPIRSEAFPQAAPRPHYSVLDKERIKQQLTIPIPHWQVALRNCLVNMGEGTIKTNN